MLIGRHWKGEEIIYEVNDEQGKGLGLEKGDEHCCRISEPRRFKLCMPPTDTLLI
jgi:hypothetical protein